MKDTDYSKIHATIILFIIGGFGGRKFHKSLFIVKLMNEAPFTPLRGCLNEK